MDKDTTNYTETTTPIDSTKDWFNQQQTPLSTLPPKRSKKKLFIVLALIVLLVAASLIAAFTLSGETAQNTTQSCFDAKKYDGIVQLLTNQGSDVAELKPQRLLSSYEVDFTPNLTTLDGDTRADTQSFIAALGEYSQTTQSSAPIVIHISANYSSNSAPTIPQQRINIVKEMLTKAGFSDSYIVTIPPELIIETTDTAFDENDVVVISIAPSVRCDTQENNN